MTFIPSKIQIRSLIIVESGTYNPQYRRSYSTAENEPAAVTELRDRLSGRRVQGAGAVSGLAGQIIRMDGIAGAELRIDDNGWNCPRFLFILSVDVYVHGSNLPNRQIVTGYSDHAELTLSGRIDKQMRFTINNLVTLRPVTTVDRGRKTTNMIPVDCSHVLANRSFTSLRNDTEMRISPFDVMGLMMVEQGMYKEDDAPLFLYSGLHDQTPCKVSRRYAQPTGYLASILKGFGDAAFQNRNSDTGLPDAVDHAALCASAQHHVSGSTASGDSFLLAIRSVSLDGYLSNYFTLNDLSRLHPGHPCDVFMQGQTNRVTEKRSRFTAARLGEESHQAGGTDGWGGTNTTTQFAAMVSHGVPGLMMETFFMDINFRATNETEDGSILIQIIGVPLALEDFDCRKYVDIFEARLISEILNDACMNGLITFDFECRCDVTTETWIDISVGGGDSMVFNTPTFCDSLMTPMLSGADNANGIASDLNNIVNDLVLGDNSNNVGTRGVAVPGYEDSANHGTGRNDRNNRAANSSPFRIIT